MSSHLNPTPSASIAGGKESTMDFIAIARMLAPISGETLTAYRVETPDGTVFVPFTKVHPRTFVTPLVTFG